jgi:maltose alpha-D-glucosyltransferase/alpha-amylase
MDLSRYQGVRPVEMMGQTEFPKIGKRPYQLALGPYGFYWFHL